MNTAALTAQPVASPHAHGGNSVTRTMFRVQMALVPATLYGFWLFGWPAFFLWLLTILSCLGFEALSLKMMGVTRIKATLFDGSALLTGWLLAMTLPPWAPWWVAVVGGFIAIVIGKQVFGGVGQNVFNPAMVARVALLVSFPVPLTMWVSPLPLTSLAAPDFIDGLRIFLTSLPQPDAMASASLLGYTKTELSRGIDLLHSLAGDHAPVLSWIGARSGSFGESASLLILGGGLYLIGVGIISWHTPAAVLAGLAIPAAIGHSVDPTHYLSVSAHLLSGAAMLGAFFIATDYVTSPNTVSGQIVFGLGIGLMTWVIRTYGGYPEGMAFAVLLMNALTPVIDRFIKPRVLGRDRKGKPLDIPETKEA
ncbi:RnfABCDGE type electron transport complex subunit D [Ferribacterium limneticum]|uniref:RnfABCDGE type electron transport complex subunit D n=1 Tax=Ferribacterium limneticum TaxID=76259 RepID=UPI001CFB5DA6|nr:RnfABCDGE type electron transport complex subunit D [Ferribacterium limneticum]UCV20697.1 RnfABCDGE type electron transport complex subunit D [Ferribacterium limneticum]